jgi:hypothetical protein
MTITVVKFKSMGFVTSSVFENFIMQKIQEKIEMFDSFMILSVWDYVALNGRMAGE